MMVVYCLNVLMNYYQKKHLVTGMAVYYLLEPKEKSDGLLWCQSKIVAYQTDEREKQCRRKQSNEYRKDIMYNG